MRCSASLSCPTPAESGREVCRYHRLMAQEYGVFAQREDDRLANRRVRVVHSETTPRAINVPAKPTLKMTPEVVTLAVRLREARQPLRVIAQECHVSIPTVFYALRRALRTQAAGA